MQPIPLSGTELLQVAPGFFPASIILSILMLAILIPLGIALVNPKKPFGGTTGDQVFAVAVYLVFLLGLLGWAWHTAVPTTGWRWVLFRDFIYHFGMLAGVYAFIVFGLVKIAFDYPAVRKRWENMRQHRRKVFSHPHGKWAAPLVILMLVGFFGYDSFLITQDVRDFFSTPVSTIDHLGGFHRAYRSQEGTLYFDASGGLVVPHGLTLHVWKNRSYAITYTPHRHLLVSCKE